MTRDERWRAGRVLAGILATGAFLCSSAAPAPAPAPKASAPAKPAAPAKKPEPFTVPDAFPGPMLKRFLDGPMKGVDEIVFAVRVPGRDHWYVTFGNYSDHSESPKDRAFKFEEGVYWGYGEGGRLCRLNLRTGALKTVFEDPMGGVRDPQLSYDGTKILFSYRKGGTHPFHLCEINVDGTGFRQLTDGPDDDIEPTYTPDGGIVFCSSRCRRFVNCWYTRVAALYRCEADGSNVRMLSSNNDHDNTPWMLPDGRVLYMRWEYVDRSQLHFHHLWTMNPDGTEQTVYYGNMRGGGVMLDAKPIPGTDRVVSIFSPGHGSPEHLGPVTIVDPRYGPDDPRGARTVSRPGTMWKDPWAFGDSCFLVAGTRGICVMDGGGNAELVYRLPADEAAKFQCHEPRPLQARQREYAVAPRVNLAQSTGCLLLQDLYRGRNMSGVERGAVRKLLVLQQLPKPVNFSGGMEPLTIGGSFTLAEVLGEVPVEPDGSAYMELPALRSLFFVALDERNRSVKRMHSFVTLQPGETTGCVGCHESRTQSAPDGASFPSAMRKPPARLQPVAGVPSVLDFPRDIQPILDRHCVRCHDSEKRAAGVDFSGAHTPGYSLAYWTIHNRGLVSDGRNQPYGNRAPYSYGSAASPLLAKMDGSHKDVKLSPLEFRAVQLWIDTSATYPGTYAALGCGTYPVSRPMGDLMKRCGACHTGDYKDSKGVVHKTLVIKGRVNRALETYDNLDAPEKALALRAPLAKSAGGLELCRTPVFKDRSDPLYRSLLASMQDAANRLAAGKRFDMPGFRPNPHYIREMQRFGILPATLDPAAPVDPYATDRRYWDSFNHRPSVETAGR